MRKLLRKLTSVHVLVFAIFFAVVTYYASQTITDPDIPWHIATGNYILQTHHIPTRDFFSWSSKGQPWVTQEWGFEVILAWLIKHFGFAGMVALNVIVAGATMLTMYRVSLYYTKTNKVAAMITGCLSVMIAIPFWIDRPQIASYMLFAVFLWILEQTKRKRYIPLLFSPILIWIWANLHASAIIGVLMLLFEVVLSFIPDVGRIDALRLPKGARWRLLLAGVIGAVAGVLTPLGIKSYEYALLSGNSLLSKGIVEWNAPNFQQSYYADFFVPILFLVVAIIVIRKQTQPIKVVVYAAGTCYLMFMHQRFMPYFSIAMGMLLASNAVGLFKNLLMIPVRIRVVNGILGLAVVAWFIGLVPHVQGSVTSHLSRSAYPVQAVKYMKEHGITKNVLNTYGFGGYMIYEGIPTFVDGRTDVYLRNGVFKNYEDLQNLKSDAPKVLNEYPFQTALVQKGSTLDTILSMNPAWIAVYKSDVAVVFVKKTISK